MTLGSVSYCGVCGHFAHTGYQCKFEHPLSSDSNLSTTSTFRCICVVRSEAVSRNFAKIAELVKAYKQNSGGQLAHFFPEPLSDYCGGCGHRRRDHVIDTVTDSTITGRVLSQITHIQCFADGCEPARYSYQLVR